MCLIYIVVGFFCIYKVRDDGKEKTKEQTVCDDIAGMTDRYAIVKFKEIFIPGVWSVY